MATTIKMHNDMHKCEASVEAWVTGINIGRGYGANEKEALSGYKSLLKKHIEKVKKVLDDIKSEDLTFLSVKQDGSLYS